MDQVWHGTLTKMRVEHTTPVSYWLHDGYHNAAKHAPELPMADLMGKTVELRFVGNITCVYCGRKTKKSFNQGFCFPCARARAEADICIVRPERCHHGDPDAPCRDEEFAQAHCFQPHVLYASLTSGVKVGITRRPNVPSRWIDQGAVAAVPLAVLPSRREVGLLEHRIAEDFNDKTHWMAMLKTESPEDRLGDAVDKMVSLLEEWEVDGLLPPAERTRHEFTYPVSVWPTKVKSFNLDKSPVAGGVLQGIKGQYLMFDTGVINLRKYTGYEITVHAG